MKDKEWLQFENTGKITDYLVYQNKKDTDNINNEKGNVLWGKKHEGTNYSINRNDIVSGTYRGI